MRKVLIPTDFSRNASDAFLYAVKLYCGEQVEFIVVYSFESESSSLTSRVDIGKSEQVLDKLYDDATKEGNLFIEKVKSKLGKTHCTFRFIPTGMGIFRAVNSLIEKEEIDLTVMGTKGRTADENILVGSTTIKMIRKIKKCPLLVVPSILNFEAPLKIGFATEYSTFLNLNEFVALRALLQNFKSTLEILFVGQESNLTEIQLKNREAYIQSLKEFQTHFHNLEIKESISKTLINYTTSNRIDLLILANRKHNPIVKLFRESVIKSVGNIMEVPYLLLPVI